MYTDETKNVIKALASDIIKKINESDDHGWISVDDALPELDRDVLVYAVGKEVMGMKFSNVMCITQYTDVLYIGHAVKVEPYWKSPWQYFSNDYDVKFWQYLPEPPAVKGEV